MSEITEAAVVPDSKLAREITELVRDTETDLLFNHSSRVYHFGALAGTASRPDVRSASCSTPARCFTTWA